MFVHDRARRFVRRVMWALLAAFMISALWVLKVEITYRRNAERMPALYHFGRHVITRMWST